MIRRKISTGVLRATKSTGNLRAVALAQATVPASQQQTAGLASATLLSSQRNWGKEKVSTLKVELKKRGLSQAGVKAELIDRLKSSDTSSILPPMPSIPSSHQASSSFSRNLSTSATVQAPNKKKTQGKQTQSDPQDAEVDTPDTTIVSTGPEVISLQTEAPPKVQPTPAEVSIAPGLPATKATEAPKKNTLNLRMPQPEEDRELPQNIPVEPDNFRAPEPTPEPKSSVPKVVTVASAATHTGGGPTHALHETVDAHTLEEAEETVKSGVDSLSSVLSSAISAPGRAISSSGMLPTIGAPAGFEDAKNTTHKPSNKKLDSEEKKGLWILSGIVGFGLLLGGGRKEKKDKKGHSSDGSDSSKSAAGAKGDATWEKPSGAGIVGHGVRKD